jgi:TRAP-type C4-dicarboxylate transport system permease small subunit
MMMLLITMDVFLRYSFNRPVKGSFELVEFMMAVVICLGMAYTGVQKGHVAVELLVSRFSPRVQALIDSFNWLVSMGLFLLISWKAVAQARVVGVSGLASSVLHVPVFPFLLVLAFGSGFLCLVFLVNFIDSVSRVMRK